MALHSKIDEARRTVSVCSETDYVAVSLDEVSPENITYAALYGLRVRLDRAGALQFDKAENRYPTEAEKFAAIRRVAEHLKSGSKDWDIRTAGEPKNGMLFEALRRAYPHKSADDLRAYIKARSKREQSALLNDPASPLAPHIAAIRAEMGTGVDTAALLAGL